MGAVPARQSVIAGHEDVLSPAPVLDRGQVLVQVMRQALNPWPPHRYLTHPASDKIPLTDHPGSRASSTSMDMKRRRQSDAGRVQALQRSPLGLLNLHTH